MCESTCLPGQCGFDECGEPCGECPEHHYCAEDNFCAEMRYVFVTANTYPGDFPQQTPDEICLMAAEDAGLSGLYRPIVSMTYEPAMQRIQGEGPIYNRAGEMVVQSIEDLWITESQELLAPIDVDQFGSPVSNNVQVWTGTTFDGQTSPDNCYNWTSGSARGQVGITGTTIFRWLDSGNSYSCYYSYRLYCIRIG